MQNPKVMVVFQDVAQNPANMSKYQSKSGNYQRNLEVKHNAHLTKPVLKEKQSRSFNGCHNNTSDLFGRDEVL
jgi:hypothetical protein